MYIFIIVIHTNDVKGQTALQESLQDTVVPGLPGVPIIQGLRFSILVIGLGSAPAWGREGMIRWWTLPRWDYSGVQTLTLETLTFPKQSDGFLRQ